MELRYLGFDQSGSARGYRFDLVGGGAEARQFVVTVDLALFRTHGVGIQEGPTLCAQKLSADLLRQSEGAHELTTEDLNAHADACAETEARKLAARRAGPRRRPDAPPHQESPWRGPHH